MSNALLEWHSSRSDRIDQLMAAHAMMRSPGRGRKWRTEQLNAAIIVRLAIEFQGFSRDLHNDAVDALVAHIVTTNPPMAPLLRNSLTLNRQLDKVNAQPSSLGSDFGRLGMKFWPDLASAHPSHAAHWQARLELLNLARDGIAHHDLIKLDEVANEGWPTTQLKTAKRFRSSLEKLVAAMDRVVSKHVQSLTGGPAPW